MRKTRSVAEGSNFGLWRNVPTPPSKVASGSRIASARSVGVMPLAAFTISRSPNRRRSFASARLIAGWLLPRRSAARVTLPVSSSACNTTSRLRSTFAKSIERIM
ncbi:hypothetical protein AOQ72_07975 [Bradyrhizobium yuanmingense]|uniref:Uncharacterized protein n=1 Tax=Bradyrhizobium yuanmingense TaxID=108015 RepID=A0A0R3CZ52_9BRAD|nr:hypothetical protein AOQ72_07975 [Bradyrhizobium yuanmingense]